MSTVDLLSPAQLKLVAPQTVFRGLLSRIPRPRGPKPPRFTRGYRRTVSPASERRRCLGGGRIQRRSLAEPRCLGGSAPHRGLHRFQVNSAQQSKTTASPRLCIASFGFDSRGQCCVQGQPEGTEPSRTVLPVPLSPGVMTRLSNGNRTKPLL